jgi:cytochrome b6-f complex iron-sulfur subunit
MLRKKQSLVDRAGFEESPKSRQLTRRKLFARIGLTTFLLTIGGFFTSVVAFILPKLSYEPKSSFSVGRPSDYQIGDMRLLEAEQVYMFRSAKGFQAVSAICTHLGCSYKPFGPPTSEFGEVHAAWLARPPDRFHSSL